MIGVIPAAGRGTRLGNITASIPKALVTVGGVALVDRAMAAMRGAGVEHVVVVTGHMASSIESHLRGEEAVTCVRQVELDGTAGALVTANAVVGNQPVLVAWVDVVVFPAAYRQVASELSAGAAAAIGVNAVEDPHDGAAVYAKDGVLERIIEKPARGSSTTVWNNSGIMALSAEIWPFVESTQPSERGEREVTDALNTAAAAGLGVKTVPLSGPVIDVGTADRLAEADRMFGRLR